MKTKLMTPVRSIQLNHAQWVKFVSTLMSCFSYPRWWIAHRTFIPPPVCQSYTSDFLQHTLQNQQQYKQHASPVRIHSFNIYNADISPATHTCNINNTHFSPTKLSVHYPTSFSHQLAWQIWKLWTSITASNFVFLQFLNLVLNSNRDWY